MRKHYLSEKKIIEAVAKFFGDQDKADLTIFANGDEAAERNLNHWIRSFYFIKNFITTKTGNNFFKIIHEITPRRLEKFRVRAYSF